MKLFCAVAIVLFSVFGTVQFTRGSSNREDFIAQLTLIAISFGMVIWGAVMMLR